MAHNYFKVLAIKDEYEVARLMTDKAFLRSLDEQFEGDYRLNFHLAPPLLHKPAADGKMKKSTYGPWMLKAFRLLAACRTLRNTWLDPFARTAERKTERAWLAEYEALLDQLLDGLNDDRLELAIRMATLPSQVRGYGPVKDNYLAVARTSLERLQREWIDGPVKTVVTRIAAVQV